MLIDTRNLNRNVEYDLSNKVVSFSPGVTAQELEQYLSGIGRFFPIGHSPTVGLGGFLLAGGQGWFMRGWGLSSTHSWIRQLEIVTATGETVIANRTQNEDLFWAAPGSGQGFFGVVTRIWGNTIPAKRLFDKLVVFDVTEIVNFKKILKWVLETSDKTPKYGIDMTFSVMFADRSAPGLKDDSVQKKLVLTAALVAYADHLDEANVLLSPWASTPDIFQPHLLENTSVNETTWGHLWDQEEFMPAGHGERWKCDSILTDPKIDYNEVCAIALVRTASHTLNSCSPLLACRIHNTLLMGPPLFTFDWNYLPSRLRSLLRRSRLEPPSKILRIQYGMLAGS